jgi:hypothetical protein
MTSHLQSSIKTAVFLYSEILEGESSWPSLSVCQIISGGCFIFGGLGIWIQDSVFVRQCFTPWAMLPALLYSGYFCNGVSCVYPGCPGTTILPTWASHRAGMTGVHHCIQLWVEMGVSETSVQAGLEPWSSLSVAYWVARIIGIHHQHPACLPGLKSQVLSETCPLLVQSVELEMAKPCGLNA